MRKRLPFLLLALVSIATFLGVRLLQNSRQEQASQVATVAGGYDDRTSKTALEEGEAPIRALPAPPVSDASVRGEPVSLALQKLWPGATYLSRTDTRAPLGVERVSIIRPASLPYPVRI
jgi:hypothetical protein